MGNPALQKRDEERERAIVQDYESDVSTAQIQEKYEISPGQLYRILDKYGVKPRRASSGVRVQATERTDRPTEEKPKHITIAEAVKAVQSESERKARATPLPVVEPEPPAPEPESPPVIAFDEHAGEERSTPAFTVVDRPGYVFVATVEFRTRNVVRINASSIVDAARQAGEIMSPTGGPVEVVMLAREG